jgi:hypothetical protein
VRAPRACDASDAVGAVWLSAPVAALWAPSARTPGTSVCTGVDVRAAACARRNALADAVCARRHMGPMCTACDGAARWASQHTWNKCADCPPAAVGVGAVAAITAAVTAEHVAASMLAIVCDRVAWRVDVPTQRIVVVLAHGVGVLCIRCEAVRMPPGTRCALTHAHCVPRWATSGTLDAPTTIAHRVPWRADQVRSR